MSSISGSILPCQVPLESCKFQPTAILCFSHFLMISKQKARHQILRNQKVKSLGSGLRVQNTDRCRNIVVCSSAGSGPQIPSNPAPGSGSWKPWILGFLMSIILPFWRGKWRPLLKLKEEVETVIDTVEAVTDIVEKVAEQVEKVADDMVEDMVEEVEEKVESFIEPESSYDHQDQQATKKETKEEVKVKGNA